MFIISLYKLLVQKLGNLQVKSESGHYKQRAERDGRKSQVTPDWKVVDLIREGIYKSCLRQLQD